jgi:misacylated tRNA(Ala) deacylase
MPALLFRDDAYRKSCTATVVAARAGDAGATHGVVELDQALFYPLGGGQPGDTGVLRAADGKTWRVIDARKGEATDQVLHLIAPDDGLPAVGTALEAAIDWERRHRHMRLHTALHLLGAVVGAPVTGGRIAEDKAHLDFDIEMEKLVKSDIEARVNALVSAGHATRASWITDEELDARPELVRTMSVAPPRGAGRVRLLEIPGVDLQACGGTHVANTSEIGALAVIRIRSEGKRNKRVTIAFAT